MAVLNNLCPVCEAKRVAGEDIKNTSIRIKVDPSGVFTKDVLLCCVHEGDCSLLDVTVCGCGRRGFLMPPEEQNGIYHERSEYLNTLELDLTDEGKGVYCKQCNLKVPCEECGTEVRRRKTINTITGTKQVCSNCAEEYRECFICGQVHTKWNGMLEQYICDNCAPFVFRCACGSLTTEVFDFGGEKACTNCTSHGICSWCGEEGRIRHVEDSIKLCAAHAHIIKDLPAIEGYHHTKVSTLHKGEKEGNIKLYIGIENEFQLQLTRLKYPVRNLQIRKRQLAKVIKEYFPTTECKRDGSLSTVFQGKTLDNGVEAAWQPQSFSFIHQNRDKYKDMWKKIHPKLAVDNSKCGMHIHLSKAGFTPFHFLKFTNFFYTSEKQGFMLHIARRASNSYARLRDSWNMKGHLISCKETGKSLAYYDVMSKGKHVRTRFGRSFIPERYDAINITPTHTYEIRSFLGAKTYEEFMSCIEFTYSVYAYTKDASHKDMSLIDYFKYVRNNPLYYPELIKIIEVFERGM